ncbi:MAG: M60 family metallopeptidase [Prevotella sp.]|nr:M60 family metallopeptidase [Prevotella sp.]
MKRIIFITSLLAVFSIAAEAQSIRLENSNIKKQLLMIGREAVTLDYSDFTTVAVAANCDYTATANEAWLTTRRMANGNTAIYAQPNYNMAAREGTIVFTSADGSVERKLSVTQNGFDASDRLIPIASGTASNSQSGEGIERSFDANLSTLYHSNYSTQNTFPITLTYTLKEISHVDYAVYTPRQDGNVNGNFQEVTVSYQVDNKWITLGTFNLEGSSAASRIPFGDSGVDNVKSLRFVVKSGTNGFASCAEMEFYEKNSFMEDMLSNFFADNLCTQLREGITAEEIEQIPVAEIRDMAKAMIAGTYSTEFRLGEFTAVRPLGELSNELKNSYWYNNHENPTGITFDQDESIIVMAEGIGSQSVALQVRNFGPEVFASSSYPLQNGINVIKVTNRGNGYINYYTSDWKAAPKVTLHFLNAKEQGYFSPKYKGHTNADWKRLLAKAKGDCLDMHGEFCDAVFPVSSFKSNCPNDGEWLMATYDSIISVEREMMGIFKYKHEVPNRQCAITVATSGGLYHASNDGFCVPVNALRDPTSNVSHFDFWGAAHEFGHQNQTQGLRWVGLTEVTNNIMSAYVQHKLQANGYHRLENESNGFRYYDYFEYNIMKGGQFLPHAHGDVFCTLIPFWQLLIYTRMAGIQPDAYPELYETLRKQTALSSMNDGQHQVNFMKQWCHITKTNFLPFFKQVGMFKTVDESISDYSTRQLTITQAMLNSLENEINAANYPEPPAGFCYLDVNNYSVFRDKAALVENTVGKGCSRSGSNVVIQHSQWKNVVGFETYKADGTLLHMTNYGHGDSAIKPNTTSVVWNTSESPAYIMAVGYDGTRVKCYEP